MSINSFTFDGVSSEDMGLYVGGQKTFGAPQRDVTKVSIPGRNGDLVRDNGRFLNSEIAYNIVAMNDFKETAQNVRNWLMSAKGYKRLEDTYHPEHYRMARVSGGIDFETGAYNATGKAQILFDCMPQRFLKLGETPMLMEANGTAEERTIINPTEFDSKPFIKVYGSGTGRLVIGNQTVYLWRIDDYLEIDSETMNCYKDVVNYNQYVEFGTRGFPTLPPGDTTIEMLGGVTRIEITGRWWEL